MIADGIQSLLLLRDDPRIIKCGTLPLLAHWLRMYIDIEIQLHRFNELQIKFAFQPLAKGVLQIAGSGPGRGSYNRRR